MVVEYVRYQVPQTEEMRHYQPTAVRSVDEPAKRRQ